MRFQKSCLFTCRERAIPIACSGTSSVMVDPAAVIVSLAIVTGATSLVFDPINA